MIIDESNPADLRNAIEPELRSSPPRRVQDSPSTQKFRLGSWNLLPAILCLAYYWYSQLGKGVAGADIAHDRQQGIIYIAAGTAIYVAILLWADTYFAQRRALLRDGIAVVAIISERRKEVVNENSTSYLVKYRFTNPKTRRTVTREMPVTEKIYRKCLAGTPMTILYHPDDVYNSLPYFELTEAQIVDLPRTPFLGSAIDG